MSEDLTHEEAGPRRRRPGLRLRTVVLALILLSVAVGSLAGQVWDLDVDAGTVAVVGLMAAGAVLLAGAVLGARRRAPGASAPS